MKIIDYKIIQADSLTNLASQVNDYIQQGYTPSGTPSCLDFNHISQVMIKYDDNISVTATIPAENNTFEFTDYTKHSHPVSFDNQKDYPDTVYDIRKFVLDLRVGSTYEAQNHKIVHIKDKNDKSIYYGSCDTFNLVYNEEGLCIRCATDSSIKLRYEDIDDPEINQWNLVRQADNASDNTNDKSDVEKLTSPSTDNSDTTDNRQSEKLSLKVGEYYVTERHTAVKILRVLTDTPTQYIASWGANTLVLQYSVDGKCCSINVMHPDEKVCQKIHNYTGELSSWDLICSLDNYAAGIN